MALVTLNFENILTEWKVYSINNVAQFTFCHLEKLALINILNTMKQPSRLSGTYLLSYLYLFPEHLISNLEAIKGKERCS